MHRLKRYAYETVERFPAVDEFVPNFDDMATVRAWHQRRRAWEALNGLPKDAPYDPDDECSRKTGRPNH
jgi:hypothetical protein